jgi:hypothetical protein
MAPALSRTVHGRDAVNEPPGMGLRRVRERVRGIATGTNKKPENQMDKRLTMGGCLPILSALSGVDARPSRVQSAKGRLQGKF